MKTLNQLEEEAKQAREEAIKEISQYVPNAIEVADKLILAAVAMVTYQFALGMQDQKEVDADGWISWNGGECPVDKDLRVFVKLRYGIDSFPHDAGIFRWNHADKSGLVDGNPKGDIVAYKISKGE